MPLNAALRSHLEGLITRYPVVLFMKGSRGAPQCGFSASVVQILDDLVPAYETVDVLANPELRDGIKEFSEWPTIPQLYVQGNFIGGSDIVKEMHATGELAKLLGPLGPSAQAPPTITLSPRAEAAFVAALEGAEGDVLRFEVSARYEYGLFFGPAEKGDIVTSAGAIAIHLDRSSARRADGTSIDFVEGEGGGFKIENKSEPPKVKQISASELKAMLDAKDRPLLLDVRTLREREIAQIAGARVFDQAAMADVMELDRGTPIVLHCHHGMRSQAAAEQLLKNGFRKLYNLVGGIDAWSQAVDPTVPRY